MDKTRNCINSISRWRKNIVPPGQVKISSLKLALEEEKKDNQILHDEIVNITKKKKLHMSTKMRRFAGNRINIYGCVGDKNIKIFMHLRNKDEREIGYQECIIQIMFGRKGKLV